MTGLFRESPVKVSGFSKCEKSLPVISYAASFPDLFMTAMPESISRMIPVI